MDESYLIPLDNNTDAVARWIWKNLVPKSGQCDTVQGELLRIVEKLCWEAQNNGNINWDTGFNTLLDYLESTLCSEPAFSSESIGSIHADVKTLRDFMRPYTDQDLYDRLTEHVIAFCRLHPSLIQKPADPNLKR